MLLLSLPVLKLQVCAASRTWQEKSNLEICEEPLALRRGTGVDQGVLLAAHMPSHAPEPQNAP